MNVSPYSSMGASWANDANRNRGKAQALSQLWGQYAPQRHSTVQGWNQLATNKSIAAKDQSGQMFRFGIGALTGLMR
jgi:hypothetical protein